MTCQDPRRRWTRPVSLEPAVLAARAPRVARASRSSAGSPPRLGAATSCVDDARLVATELVGNAVRHARPLADGTMLVALDARTGPALDIVGHRRRRRRPTPERVDAGACDLAGRGLAIVEALTSTLVGRARTPSRTTVHALLAPGLSRARADAGSGRRP